MDRWTRIIAEVREKIGADNLFKVPGIVRPESPEFSIRGSGIAVPVRNIDGLIVGLRIRQERHVFKKKGGTPPRPTKYLPRHGRELSFGSGQTAH